MSNCKRIAIYVRVSTTEQSVDLQLRELNEFVSNRGWKSVEVYEDQVSGTTSNRPALKKLLKDCRSRKVDLVICWRMDRLFRSLSNLIAIIQEFNDLGIEFIALRDQIDMTTASGRLMIHLLGAFAEFEANLIKERVRAGIATARSKGKILGRPRRICRNTVRSYRSQGLSISAIAIKIGVTKGAVSKILKNSVAQMPISIGNIYSKLPVE